MTPKQKQNFLCTCLGLVIAIFVTAIISGFVIGWETNWFLALLSGLGGIGIAWLILHLQNQEVRKINEKARIQEKIEHARESGTLYFHNGGVGLSPGTVRDKPTEDTLRALGVDPLSPLGKQIAANGIISHREQHDYDSFTQAGRETIEGIDEAVVQLRALRNRIITTMETRND